MESLDRSNAVCELGKRLVADLDREDGLLVHWMAHEVASRIDAVERSEPDSRAAAQIECAKLIFALWRQRYELPPQLRPFRELEPLIRTLVSLDDVRGDEYRYFGSALREAAVAETDGQTKDWLELALGLDSTARLLIQFALKSAAATVTSDELRLIELAKDAGLDSIAEQKVAEFVFHGFNESPEADELVIAKARKELNEKIAQLEGVAEMAVSAAAVLRKRLGESTSSGNSDDSEPAD